MPASLAVPRRSRVTAVFRPISTALAHAPENAAYGLVAFAPLGPGFAAEAMALALLGTAVGNLVATGLGDGRLVSGQRAAMAILTAGLVASLVSLLERSGAGPASAAAVLALCTLGVVGAGALQCGSGLLKLGSVVKYTPLPVRIGVMSGVGLLLIVTAVPLIVGQPFGTGLRSAFDSPEPGAMLIAACALAVSLGAIRLRLGLPPELFGLLAAALLYFVMSTWLPAAGWGGPMREPRLPHASLAGFEHGWRTALGAVSPELLALLGSYALSVAVLCSLDTLLAITIVDGRLQRKRDANRELAGQGIATVVAGIVSGLPLSPSIPRSLALVGPEPTERQAVPVYAAALLALLLLAPQLLGRVPTSALGGVLLLQGLQMVAPAFWRAPLDLLRLRRRSAVGRQAGSGRPMRTGDWAVELVVALSAVVLGLGPAILIGASCAVLLFVRGNMRDVVHAEWTGATRRSLKTRPSPLAEALAAAGGRIALLELQGTLFFGTSDGLRGRLATLEPSVDTAILDLHQVIELDATAAQSLIETAERWERAGKHLVLSEWSPGDPRRRLLEAAGAGAAHAGRALRFRDHTDLALEEAEDRLLASLGLLGDAGRPLPVAETMLGRGLDGAELAALEARLELQRYGRGQILFRVGDPGDGLLVSVKGDIGLQLPGSDRRLASFAPGIVIGEMAMLTGSTRSAEAVAESDVTALKLSTQAFERLMAEQPELAAKLLRNISLHLADRVRALTGELSRWVTRAGAGAGAGRSRTDEDEGQGTAEASVD